MRRAVRAALSDAGQGAVAVVCGAWHVPALDPTRATAASDAGLAKAPPGAGRAALSWVPWSDRKLEHGTGYGAGVAWPGWYRHVFRHPGPDGVTRFFVEAAAGMRARGLAVSPDHLIAAARLADAAGRTAQPSAGRPRRGARCRHHRRRGHVGDAAAGHRRPDTRHRRRRRPARGSAGAAGGRRRAPAEARLGSARRSAPVGSSSTCARRWRCADRTSCTASTSWPSTGVTSPRDAVRGGRSARPGISTGIPSAADPSGRVRRPGHHARRGGDGDGDRAHRGHHAAGRGGVARRRRPARRPARRGGRRSPIARRARRPGPRRRRADRRARCRSPTPSATATSAGRTPRR